MFRTRGFTIVEVLIASVLTLLVMGMAMMLLMPTLHAAARGSMQSDMEDQAMMVMTLLRTDLDNAVAQAVSLKSDGQTIAIMPLQDVQDSGVLLWLPQLTVYTMDPVTSSVFRRVWYYSGNLPNIGVAMDGSQPVRITDAQMAALAAATNLETRMLATGVTAFTIQQGGPGPSVTDALTVTISLLRQAATGRTVPETFSVTRSFSFRNQY